MTNKERADNILIRFSNGNQSRAFLLAAIEQAIVAAVEEERAACAKVAEKAIGASRREIAAAIRARCTSSASACNTSATEINNTKQKIE